MAIIKETLVPMGFKKVGDYTFFRNEEGKVFFEGKNRVSGDVFNLSKDDELSLITLFSYEIGKSVMFWKTADKIYPILQNVTDYSTDYSNVPNYINFLKMSVFGEFVYVEYDCKNGRGVLKISDYCASIIILARNVNVDITFDNELIYVKTTDNKYDIFDLTGKFLGKFPVKYRKVEGHDIYYHKSSILYDGNITFTDGDIISAQIIVVDTDNSPAINMLFLKVKTNEKVEYYTTDLNHICSCVCSEDEKEELAYITDNRFFFAIAKKDGSYKYIVYLNFTENGIIKDFIYDSNGIGVLHDSISEKYFFITDNIVYLHNHSDDKFSILLDGNNMEFDKFVLMPTNVGVANNYVSVISYKNGIPVFVILYDLFKLEDGKIEKSGNLTVTEKGWDKNTFICKFNDDENIIIEPNKVIWLKSSQWCHKRSVSVKMWDGSYAKVQLYMSEKNVDKGVRVSLIERNGEIFRGEKYKKGPVNDRSDDFEGVLKRPYIS